MVPYLTIPISSSLNLPNAKLKDPRVRWLWIEIWYQGIPNQSEPDPVSGQSPEKLNLSFASAEALREGGLNFRQVFL
jgi:hypothetical protein